MPELLLEIGTEEIPARFLKEAVLQLKEKAEEIFKRERLDFSSPQTFATPRRLVLWIEELSEKQKSKLIEKWGPFLNQAFDEQGNPTKSALGFARSLGVELSQLEKKETPKGVRLYYYAEQEGKETKELLKELLPELILSLRFPKSMRWAEAQIRFARPVHWILARFNQEVVEFKLDGIKSGGLTYGHRFLAPEPLEVRNFAEYCEALEKHYVIVDHNFRREMIEAGLSKKAEELDAELYPAPELVWEVTFLVEYPVVLAGRFEERFLALPAEVLISAMGGHQRYFALKKPGSELELVPYFLFVANTEAKDPGVVIKGNERVLRARLEDAEFFYQEDLKLPLEKRVEELSQMVFQAGLGTYLEKTHRLENLVGEIIDQLAPEEPNLKKLAIRSAHLCKADLLTQMVGEFPELEGIMAGEYARVQGEPELVWKAIREHYLPKTARDIEQNRFPQTIIGKALSIVDKLDQICAGFVLGNQPTGSADPFGIRRSANAIIQITINSELDFHLDSLIEKNLQLLAPLKKFDQKKLKEELINFFCTRQRNILIEQGIEYDIADAVLCAWEGRILSAFQRAEALSELRREPGFNDLFIGFRRVARIIEEPDKLDPNLFEQEEEKSLWQAFLKIKSRVEELVEQRKWKEAMKELAWLKPEIDRFFDTVLVNVEDEALRKNRHSLLEEIAREFRKIADFSQLSAGEKTEREGENG